MQGPVAKLPMDNGVRLKIKSCVCIFCIDYRFIHVIMLHIAKTWFCCSTKRSQMLDQTNDIMAGVRGGVLVSVAKLPMGNGPPYLQHLYNVHIVGKTGCC